MSREARLLKRIRRNLVDMDRFQERYMNRYKGARRKVRSDRHMQHLWVDEFKYKLNTSDRKRAPFHKGGKP